MKFSQIIFRAGLGMVIGFVISVSSSALTFDYSSYGFIDRAFLFAVPAFAIAYLFFIFYPNLQNWLKHIQAVQCSPKYYVIGFLFSLLSGYGAVGFLDEVLEKPIRVFLFTLIFVLTSIVFAYHLVRRASHSFQDGFLHKPLNVILCLILPILFAAVLILSAQFPSMFLWEYITIPQNLLGSYLAGALIAGILGISALDRFNYRRFQTTKLFSFIRENLPGLYAGGMFFLINLIIARALNHPALGYNSVLFETDAGPWMTILGSPASDAINRAVHPLVLIITRPLIRLPGIFMGAHWNLAPILLAAAMSGLCVFMAYLFVKRATGADTYAFLFAVLLGSTSTHLLFGSLTENYVFGMASLIFFFLLIQAGENRFTVLILAGTIVFGITVTNIAQTAIGLIFNKNFEQSPKSGDFGVQSLPALDSVKKAAEYCFRVVILGVALTVLTSVLYPNAQTFFFVPADLAFEGNFVKPTYASPLASVKEKFQVATRTMLLYEIVAPTPLIVISQKKTDPFPTIDLKTYDWREHRLASYSGAGNIPLALWLIFLIGAFALFAKNGRASKHLPLMLGLLGSLGFNFLMHNFYGTELFLYTPYWAYALIFFIALAYAELADRQWFQIFLAAFVLITIVNNIWFIFVILRALAPFFAA